MRSERAIAIGAGLAAALVALLTTPEPAGTLRLAAAGLLAAGMTISLFWHHPRAPLVAAAILVAGLAVSPTPDSPLWALAMALLALLSLAAAHADLRVQALPAALGVTTLAALLILGMTMLLPRLGVPAVPLLLLLAGLLALCLGAMAALARHGGPSAEPSTPRNDNTAPPDPPTS